MTPPPQTPSVTRFVRSVLGPDAGGPADADLLARFAADRDEAAFALLVWRHAGMVLRVCRGVVRDHHAAEDATQAVFLALARQAGAVGRRGTVAGWLYRVARRVAARSAKLKRAEPAGSGANFDQLPGRVPDADPDVSRLLHAELDRLPDRYRTPVLLCYFEGLTHADAARRLGWPVGTVATRVLRAKARLHRRLTARGVTMPAALAAVVADPVAGVGPAFAAATARLAVAFVGRAGGGVPPAILALVKEEFQAMTATKLMWAAGATAVCGALTFGGMWAAGQGPGPTPADPPLAARPAPAAGPGPAATATDRQRSRTNLDAIIHQVVFYENWNGSYPDDIRDIKSGKPLLSWRVAVLATRGDPFNRFRYDEPWDSDHNKKLLDLMPDEYRVATQPPGATETYYQMVKGPGTAYPPRRPGDGPKPVPDSGNRPSSAMYYVDAMKAWPGPKASVFTDGTGTGATLAVVEAGRPVPWTKPDDLAYDPDGPLPDLTGPYRDVLNVAFFNGAVRCLRRPVDPAWLRAMISPNGGEKLVRLVPGREPKTYVETAEFARLLAPDLAATPDELAVLQKRIEANRELADEIGRLARERVEVIGENDTRAGKVWGASEAEAKRLREEIRVLRRELKKWREAPVGKTTDDVQYPWYRP